MKKIVVLLLMVIMVLSFTFAKGDSEDQVTFDSDDSFAAAKAFYSKKDVQVYVPLGAGGGMDVAARNASPFLKDLLGAKSISVINKVGASGVICYNFLNNEAVRDGSVICFGSHPAVNEIVQNDSAVRYKSEDFTYLGTVQHTNFALTVVPDSKYVNLDNLRKATSFSVGGFGFNDSMSMYGALICEIIGNKGNFVIGGYGTAANTLLAMAQGEVDAYASPMDSLYRYVNSGQCVPILIFANERDKYWPDVPTVFEVFDVTPEQRAMVQIIPESDRMVFAPPNIPADRADFLDYCLIKLFENSEFQDLTIKSTGYYSGALNAQETREKCMQMVNNEKSFRILDTLISKWMK